MQQRTSGRGDINCYDGLFVPIPLPPSLSQTPRPGLCHTHPFTDGARFSVILSSPEWPSALRPHRSHHLSGGSDERGLTLLSSLFLEPQYPCNFFLAPQKTSSYLLRCIIWLGGYVQGRSREYSQLCFSQTAWGGKEWRTQSWLGMPMNKVVSVREKVNSLYFNCQSIQLPESSFASFDVKRLRHDNRLSAQSRDQVNSLLLTCEWVSPPWMGWDSCGQPWQVNKPHSGLESKH